MNSPPLRPDSNGPPPTRRDSIHSPIQPDMVSASDMRRRSRGGRTILVGGRDDGASMSHSQQQPVHGHHGHPSYPNNAPGSNMDSGMGYPASYTQAPPAIPEQQQHHQFLDTLRGAQIPTPYYQHMGVVDQQSPHPLNRSHTHHSAGPMPNWPSPMGASITGMGGLFGSYAQPPGHQYRQAGSGPPTPQTSGPYQGILLPPPPPPQGNQLGHRGSSHQNLGAVGEGGHGQYDNAGAMGAGPGPHQGSLGFTEFLQSSDMTQDNNGSGRVKME